MRQEHAERKRYALPTAKVTAGNGASRGIARGALLFQET